MDNSNSIYEEKRPWGNFRRFTNNILSTVKIITVNPNSKLSLQSHEKREEFWRVLSGSGFFEIADKIYEVKSGDEYTVLAGQKHRIIGGEEGISILEISTGVFDENDITRYEDDYGRI